MPSIFRNPHDPRSDNAGFGAEIQIHNDAKALDESRKQELREAEDRSILSIRYCRRMVSVCSQYKAWKKACRVVDLCLQTSLIPPYHLQPSCRPPTN